VAKPQESTFEIRVALCPVLRDEGLDLLEELLGGG